MINGKALLLCVLTSAFIQEFSDLLAFITPPLWFEVSSTCILPLWFLFYFVLYRYCAFFSSYSVSWGSHSLKGRHWTLFCPLVLFLIALISVRLAYTCLITKLLFLSTSFYLLFATYVSSRFLNTNSADSDFIRPSPLHLHIAINKIQTCLQMNY